MPGTAVCRTRSSAATATPRSTAPRTASTSRGSRD